MSFGARDAASAPLHSVPVTTSWCRTGDWKWMPERVSSELCSNAAACTVCIYVVVIARPAFVAAKRDSHVASWQTDSRRPSGSSS